MIPRTAAFQTDQPEIKDSKVMLNVRFCTADFLFLSHLSNKKEITPKFIQIVEGAVGVILRFRYTKSI
jgi:hypothetical protein